TMGFLAQEMIRKASQSLFHRDYALARDVFELEKTVNQFHLDVDDLAVKLIALHQPMAVDLRLIFAAMKTNSDLERIGDQAVNVCQTCYYHLFKEPPVPQVKLIERMSEISENMLRESLEAFKNRDVKLAGQVLAQD